MLSRRTRRGAPRAAGTWPRGILLAALSVCAAVPAFAGEGIDIGPSRSVRLEGTPERLVMCDLPGGPPVLGLSLGRRVVPIARALDGEVMSLDPRRCEPLASTRSSVQCTQGRGPETVHIDVRLVERARRVGKGTFGERWEYRSLRVRRLIGQEAVSWADDQIELEPDEMFEDRAVRRMDRPGRASNDGCGLGFLVIRSHVQRGAALALYALSPSGGLESLAVSAPLGAPDRWRDVVGIGDVLGDRRPRVVEVLDPHVAGRLQVSELRDGRIGPTAFLDGYTTHRFGTIRQGIGALIDLNGDGALDIVLPTSDWKCLAVVSAENGALRELGRLSCGSAPIVDVAAADISGDGRDDLVAVRADGTLEVWTR